MGFPVVVRDDKKGKRQSVEASINFSHVGAMGNYSFDVTGYGFTEDEARAALKVQIDEVRKWISGAEI